MGACPKELVKLTYCHGSASDKPIGDENMEPWNTDKLYRSGIWWVLHSVRSERWTYDKNEESAALPMRYKNQGGVMCEGKRCTASVAKRQSTTRGKNIHIHGWRGRSRLIQFPANQPPKSSPGKLKSTTNARSPFCKPLSTILREVTLSLTANAILANKCMIMTDCTSRRIGANSVTLI
jgi:hypothetical protein